MKPKIKVFSFFSGSGFLDLGFESVGYEIVFVNEIHKPFLEAYRYSRSCLNISAPEYGYSQDSIIEFTQGQKEFFLKELIKDCRKNSDIIGFVGGPPCPDFSIGGKNKGHEGDQGKLSACYIEVITKHLPDFFVFENVKGLWTTKKHRAFYEKLKEKLFQQGYLLTEKLINAIEYGTPQDRNRVILIGFCSKLLSDLGVSFFKAQLFPEQLLSWDKHILYPTPRVFEYPWSKSHIFAEDSELPCPDGIPQELTVEHWFRQNDVLNHPNAEHYFKPRAGIKRFASINEGDDSRKSFKRLHRWRYSPTACYGNNEVHLHPYKIRRISVAEALALQSMPKEFALPPNMSLTNMFKTIGNGVPYLASKSIAKTIIEFLFPEKQSSDEFQYINPIETQLTLF